MIRIVVGIGAALISAVVVAQTPTTPDGLGNGDRSRRICRVTLDTGSRLNRRRVCLTQAEWAAQQLESRNMVDRAQTKQVNPSTRPGGSCCL